LCLSRLRLSRLCTDAQRKVHGHRCQLERRKNRTQANSTRDPWIRIGNHDVIAPIKTINYELNCTSSLHE
jgi:hypothetical protein